MPDKPAWLSAPITTSYGAPDAISGAVHNAVDFGVPAGTAVPAGVSGVVERTWSDAIGGNQVSLRTADNFHIIFAHLQQSVVQPGMSVTSTSVIGQSGSSGRVTGPHLHVGVTDPKGAAVNPLEFFAGAIARPGAGFIPAFALPQLPTPGKVGDIRSSPPGSGPGSTAAGPGPSLVNVSVPGFEQVGKFFEGLGDFFSTGLWRAGFLILGGAMFIVGFRMYTETGGIGPPTAPAEATA